MTEQTIVPVILSGGSGTRLWPVSRESFPKQLWPLLSHHSLLQETALRGHGPGFAAPVVVCNEEHRFLIAEQLREVGITNARILLEPMGRNSGPAIAAAAVLLAGRPGRLALDDGRRRLHHRRRGSASGAASGGRGGARGQDRYLRDATDRA